MADEMQEQTDSRSESYDELEQWIEKAKSEGFNRRSIYDYLLKHGYSKRQLRHYFKSNKLFWHIGMAVDVVAIIYLVYLLIVYL